MIGRVLAFVACVALVAAETCNNGDNTGCCTGADHAHQLQNAGSTSLPTAKFNAQNSGFLSNAGGFKISVETHNAYWLAGGSALATTGTYTNLPKIEIACMGASCPANAASDASGSAPNGLPTTTHNPKTDCMGLLTRHFSFSQIAGSGAGAANGAGGNGGAPSWVDDNSSTTQTFVYAAVNVIQAAKIYGETYTSEHVERLAIETISFYFKFQKQISVTATSTVTYAAVQINVVLTQSSVTPVSLTSFINNVNAAGASCTCPVTNPATNCAQHGANFCGINPEVKLEVGIVTITNLPFMTVLRMADDVVGTAGRTIPYPPGIQIRAQDVASGLNFDNTYSGGSTQRAHTYGDVPSTCNGACAVGSCDGSCALSYKAYLTYQRDVTDGTGTNSYTPGVDDNTSNTQCQIVGAVLTVGNNGIGMTASTLRYQEIQCRSQVNAAYADPCTGAGCVPDPPCPFDADGTDADDDFQLRVQITTSNWCPNIIADNKVIGFMKTSHDSYFDGNRLDITVYVQAQAATSGQTNLDIDKVAWSSLRAACAVPDDDSCNVGGDGAAGMASTNSLNIIGGTVVQLGQTHQVKDNNNYDGCDATDAGNFSNSLSNSNGYHCKIQASVHLCQFSPYVGTPGSGGACPASGTSAFEIDSTGADAATSTKIVLTGELKVGYPSVPIARKRTVEINQGIEKMYALLQNTEGTAEAEAEAGIQRAPTEEVGDFTDETVTDNQSGGNDNTAAVEEESNPMLIYIIVGVFLFISVFVGALVMYLRRSKAEKKAEHPVPITVEANKDTAAMA